ncbi:sulfatase-like hydrolase/transferase [candidate division KSB1 bacterium]|nr:sulfatase-like hydrolase/transferase [candidate division KSB1 bacterium]
MKSLNRREFNKNLLKGIGAVTAVSASMTGSKTAAAKSRKRPNIVFICSDQHAYKYAGFMGHDLVKTPNLDRIARNGVVFTNNYSGNPVCVPGRSAMMTGMYASDCHSYCNSTVWDGSHPTWSKRLQDAGYYCRAAGKLDLNEDFDMGFVHVETSNGHYSNPDITSLFRRPCVYRINERDQINGGSRDSRHKDESTARNAVNFIRNETKELKKPWVCYTGFLQPHPGFTALKKYYDMYYPNRVDTPNVPPDYLENLHIVYQELRNFKRIATPIADEKMRKARAGYYGMITELDEYVGQIWDALAASGQLENTIFIYTSDHGEALGEHGMWLKNNLFDVAARVPLVIAGAGIPKGVTVDTPVGHVDLVAAILEWAGADKPDNLRGRSLAPLMFNKPEQGPQFAFSETHSEGNCTGSFMVRKGDWKYIYFSFYDDLLFNVREDPYELNNLANAPEAQEIKKELYGILTSLLDPDKVTLEAFEVQGRKLKEIADPRTEDELTEYLTSRLGEGQARLVAKKIKQGKMV